MLTAISTAGNVAKASIRTCYKKGYQRREKAMTDINPSFIRSWRNHKSIATESQLKIQGAASKYNSPAKSQ